MTTPPLIFGPTPPFNNPPIEPQFFQPSQFVISNITLGVTTIVTTNVNMNYVIGQLVRLLIPNTFGSRELNGKEAYVIALPAANQVELELNSIGSSAYIASNYPTPAQIIAVGDIANGLINNTGRIQPTTAIPGSFINISPG